MLVLRIIAILAFCYTAFAQENTTLLGRYAHGACGGIVVTENNTAFFGNGGYLQIVDFSLPEQQVLLSEILLPGKVTDVYVDATCAYVVTGRGGLHLLDVSDFESPCHVFTIPADVSISSAAISGDYLYILDFGSGLRVFNVSDQWCPVEIHNQMTGNLPIDISIQGEYAYVICLYNEGLRIYDLSDPGAPEETTSYDLQGWSYDVFLENELAYIANSASGMLILNVADPFAPYELGSVFTGGDTEGVFVQEHTAYAVDYYNGLSIIDVSDPQSPSLLGVHDYEEPVYEVVVNNEYWAFITNSTRGLSVLDVSEPSNANETTCFYTEGYFYGLSLLDGLSIIASWDRGVRLVDISDIALPTLTGDLDTPGECWHVAGSSTPPLAFLADGATLRILDISAPETPLLLSSYSIPAQKVEIAESVALVAGGPAGIRMLDVSQPEEPIPIGFLDIDQALDLFIEESIVFVAGGSSGIHIVDITIPSDPVVINTIDDIDCAEGIAVEGSYLFAAAGYQGIVVFDISNLEDPFYCSSSTTTYAMDVASSNGYAYVANMETGLHVFDVSNPYAVSEVGFFETGGLAREVEIDDEGHIYIVDVTTGMYIIRNDLLDGINQEMHIQPELLLPAVYPNPFNPSTTIVYSLSSPGIITVSVYNIRGQLVDVIQNEFQTAGQYSVEWTPVDLSSGIYFIELRAGGQKDVIKVGYLK